jgi:hypothetical protein
MYLRKIAVVMAATAIPMLGGTLVASSAGATPAPSNAASNFQFSVQPYSASGTQPRSEFSYDLQPGHSILDRVVILNTSKSPETFVAYPEDATSLANGGFGFQQQDRIHNVAVGTWLTIGQTQFTVPTGKQAVDTFELSIPANAPPGDHVGAIVVQQVHATPSPNAKEGVNLVLRFAVPVYVRVVGPIHPSLTVSNVSVFHESPNFPVISKPNIAVRFTVVNSGNVIMSPTSATVSISALIGGTVHTYTVHRTSGTQSRTNPLPAQILPGGRFTLTELWSGMPPYDPLTAHVSVKGTDPESPLPYMAAASSSTVWWFPWIPVVIVLGLIAGFILWRRWRRRRQRGDGPAGATPDDAPEAPDEDVADSETRRVEEVGV